jgi:hypothetical protein
MLSVLKVSVGGKKNKSGNQSDDSPNNSNAFSGDVHFFDTIDFCESKLNTFPFDRFIRNILDLKFIVLTAMGRYFNRIALFISRA